MAKSAFCCFLFVSILWAISSGETRRVSANSTTWLLNTENVHIPISTESDFGGGMNRDWIEGYYSPRKSYFRLYMAVYDEKNYPQYKDIWQDKSGHIVISGKGVLWIGFGRPARQIAFAKKYQDQGKKKGEKNKPLIRSILVDASTITGISNGAVEEKFRSHGLDMNVDVTKSPNQFGLDSVSTEFLRQNALTHSMVTYYLIKPIGNHPEWGLVESCDVLEQRVKKYDLNRIIPDKKGATWITEKLFTIKDDILLQNNKFDITDAESKTAEYKLYLIRRKVLLALIEEVEFFYDRGGKPYNILKGSFLQYVKNNKRIIDSFELGEDVSKAALDAIESSLIGDMKKSAPSKGADINLWNRFKLSVDQVKNFVSYSGTEVKLGTPNKIIKQWDVFKNYQTFSADNADHVIPKMQLAQESTNIGIRMAYDNDVPFRQLCNFIKNNFMGRLVGNLQLISRLHESDELITYGKRVADCIEGDVGNYMGKAMKPTIVTVYGQNNNEYRFYPDAQVVGSTHEKGTVLLFTNGAPENLRIRGVVRRLQDILSEADLQKEDPALKQKLDATRRAGGMVIIPQKYIKWPKAADEIERYVDEFRGRFNSTY